MSAFSTRAGSLLPKKMTLTMRISALLMLAVILPLVITVLGSALVLRPTLLAQAAEEQRSNAQSNIDRIDTLLMARLQNLVFLQQFFAIQEFVTGNERYREQALEELALGYRMDANYSAWTLFDKQGNLLLSYPSTPVPRGKYLIPPDALAHLLRTHETYISDVYFDRSTRTPFIDMYAAISAPDGHVIGIGRSTVKMNQLWTAVNGENKFGVRSYAMILDRNGVRIAYTNQDATLSALPPAMFKAIAPLPEQLQQRIVSENLYDSNGAPLEVLPDPLLVELKGQDRNRGIMQLMPALQREAYQVVQVKSQVMPWRYLVLRPVSTITQAADRQDAFLTVFALLIILLAIVVGLLLGRAITQPILKSVAALARSSKMLEKLSGREQLTANEQKWIVESSQHGLVAMKYYVDASGIAIQKMHETEQDLNIDIRRLDNRRVQRRLHEIMAMTNYIDRSTVYQKQIGSSLATAIRITNQVTEQLVSGATSAAHASEQLERVIVELRRIVGE